MTHSRAPKLTPERHARAVELFRAGRDLHHVAAVLGVHGDTVMGWIRKGEDGAADYVQFYLDAKLARSEAKQEFVIDRIAGAGVQIVCPSCTCEERCVAAADWKATAWLGERLYPELQLTQKTEVLVQQSVDQVLREVRTVTGDDGQRIMSKDAYGQLVTAIERLQGMDTPSAGGDRAGEPKRFSSG